MAQNIGELAVKLGFDVDDSKLKAFSNSVNDVFGGIVKFAGLDLGVQGIKNMATGFGETAIALRNANVEFGIANKEVQTLAAQWKVFNPTSDLNKGVEVANTMSSYYAAMLRGEAGNAFGMFGGTLADNSPEKMLQRLRTGLPLAMTQAGGNKAQVSQWLQEITGSRDMWNLLTPTDEQMEKAARMRDLLTSEGDAGVKLAESVGQLQTAWDNFINHIMARFAPGATSVLNEFSERGVKAGVSEIGKQYGGWSDWFNRNFISGSGALGYIDEMEKAKQYGPNIPTAYGPNQPAGSRLSSNWASAFAAQEIAESSGNAAARNVDKLGGMHYGLLQWNQARRAKIMAGTGIDVASASAAEQRRAELWEAQQMGMPLSSNLSAYDASEYLSHKFVMHEAMTPSHGDEAAYRARMAQELSGGDTTNNITVNVQSNSADAKHVADEIVRSYETAFDQLNLGGH